MVLLSVFIFMNVYGGDKAIRLLIKEGPLLGGEVMCLEVGLCLSVF